MAITITPCFNLQPQIGSALNFLAFGLICFVLGNLVTILFQFARRVVVEKGYNLVASDSK